MAAYLIVHRREITDSDRLRQYRDGVDACIARYEGKPVVRKDGFDVLEGGWQPGQPHDDQQPERVTVIEFPDMAALKRWYDSEDYARLKAIRQASSVSDVIAVEGAPTG